MTTSVAALLRDRADSYARDALVLEAEGMTPERLAYLTIARELRAVADAVGDGSLDCGIDRGPAL